MGRKKFLALPAPHSIRWASGDLSVSVNLEMALSINGEQHIVKLYMKAEPISKTRLHSMLYLMGSTFPDRGTPMILDVRRGKGFTPPVPANTPKLLMGEAASFVAIWRSFGEPAAVAAAQ